MGLYIMRMMCILMMHIILMNNTPPAAAGAAAGGAGEQGLLVWAHSTVCPYEKSYYADAYHCVYHAEYVEQTPVLVWDEMPVLRLRLSMLMLPDYW